MNVDPRSFRRMPRLTCAALLLTLLGACAERPAEGVSAAAPTQAPLAAAPPDIVALAPRDAEAVLWVADLDVALDDARAYLTALQAKAQKLRPQAAAALAASVPPELLDPRIARLAGLAPARGLVAFAAADGSSVGGLGVDSRAALEAFIDLQLAPQFGGGAHQQRQHGEQTLYGLTMPLASPTLWWAFVVHHGQQYVLFTGAIEPNGLEEALDALEVEAGVDLHEDATFTAVQRQMGQQAAFGRGALNLYARDRGSRPPRYFGGRLRIDAQGIELAAFVPASVDVLARNLLYSRQSNLGHTLSLAQREPSDAYLLSLSHGGLQALLAALQLDDEALDLAALAVSPDQRRDVRPMLLRALSQLPRTTRLHASARNPQRSELALSAEVAVPQATLSQLEGAVASLAERPLPFAHRPVRVKGAELCLSELEAPPFDLAFAAGDGHLHVASPAASLLARLEAPVRVDDGQLSRASASVGRLLEGDDPADVAELLILRLGVLFADAGPRLPSDAVPTPEVALRAAAPLLGDVALAMRLRAGGVYLHLANFSTPRPLQAR